VQIGITADARFTLRALNDYLSAFPPKARRDLAPFKDSVQYFAERDSYSNAVPMKPQRLMRELRKGLPRDAVIFGDMGNTYSWILRYFQSYPEGMNFLPSGLACMGSAVAAAIGAKLGKPEAPVVCICGDGDFLMTGMEVLTAVQYGIPVIWVILKNNRLGAIYDVQALSYQGRYSASTFRDIDFSAIARAFGAHGFKAEKPDDVVPALKAALEADGPAVLEAVVDPDEKFPLTRRATAMKDSLGLPKVMDSISKDSISALLKMFANREA
ncbi:MAG: thiamine pyrophosphate-dependent enzyme, partial [Dehalococcoidales bacterium]|nr:thiamine pyrophosphate-dependent enzyme [Dehalococcoidales bacterium]